MMNPQNSQNRQGWTSVNSGQGTVGKKGFYYQPSPKADFKKLKLSPDTAEGKTDRPGLKDLGKLLEQSQTNTPEKQLEQGITIPRTSSMSPKQSQNGPKNHNNNHKPHRKNHPKKH